MSDTILIELDFNESEYLETVEEIKQAQIKANRELEFINNKE